MNATVSERYKQVTKVEMKPVMVTVNVPEQVITLELSEEEAKFLYWIMRFDVTILSALEKYDDLTYSREDVEQNMAAYTQMLHDIGITA